MSEDEREDTTIYEAVVNHEEQYSIWPADRELPLGWSKAGKSGPKPEALAGRDAGRAAGPRGAAASRGCGGGSRRWGPTCVPRAAATRWTRTPPAPAGSRNSR